MGIKIKNRDPKTTDFASTDLVINRKTGALFFKSDSSLVKLTESSEETSSGPGEWDGSAVTLTGKLTGGAQEIEGSNFDINGGHIHGVTLGNNNVVFGGTLSINTGATLAVTGSFDVSDGTLTLADNQISGDKVEGGTIASITISQLGGAIDCNNENMTNVDINSGTIDGTDITVGSSKTLDVSSGTLTTSTAQNLSIINNAGHTEILKAIDAYHTNYNEASGDWIGPRRHTDDFWSINFGNNTEVLTLDVDYVSSGIIVPFACTLLGFQATIVAHSDGTPATTQFALYKGDFDYANGSSGASSFNITSGTASNMTLTQVSTVTTNTPGALGNPMFVSVTNGTTALAQNDMLYPRLKHNDTGNSDLYFRMNILIKR